MFRKWIVPSVLAIGVAGVAVWAAEKDEEQTLKLTDAPQVVQDAVKKALGTNQLTGFSKETDDGKIEYAAEFTADGTKNSVSFATDGSVIETEQQIDPEKLPAPVIKAVKEAHPDGKIKKAELSTANGKSVYEIKISEELVVSTDGTIQKDKDKD
jgi:uncharacterized membrane protein YkoI